MNEALKSIFNLETHRISSFIKSFGSSFHILSLSASIQLLLNFTISKKTNIFQKNRSPVHRFSLISTSIRVIQLLYNRILNLHFTPIYSLLELD